MIPIPKPMLCESASEDDLNKVGYWAEEKLDGTRILVVVDGNDVRLFSRAGIEYTKKFPQLVNDFKMMPGIWDGELVFFDKETKRVEFFTVAATDEVKKTRGWKYVVFDNLVWSDYRYEGRRELLEAWIAGVRSEVIELVKISKTNHREFYDEIVKNKGEGVVLKKIDSYYSFGRNKDWLKIKHEPTEDVKVIGWVKGYGRRERTFGALKIIDKDGKTANVGTGFSDEMLQYIVENHLTETGVKKEFFIEIKFLNRTKTSYRMPRFMRIRDDKYDF